MKSAVLDGELVCLDEFGRSKFDDLLFRKKPPGYYAFDLLFGMEQPYATFRSLQGSSI